MAVPIAGSGDLHFSAGPVVANGIITQVLAQLIQQGPVAVYKSTFPQTGQRDISPAGIQLLTLHTLLCNVQQIDRFHFRLRAGLACVVQTGELQDIIDQLASTWIFCAKPGTSSGFAMPVSMSSA